MYSSNVGNKNTNLNKLRKINLYIEFLVIVSRLIKIYFFWIFLSNWIPIGSEKSWWISSKDWEMFRGRDNRPDCEDELLNSKAWKKLLILCTNVKLLTIFHEGKVSKYFSNELMKNGWKFFK